MEKIDPDALGTRAIGILFGATEIDGSERFTLFHRLVWTLPCAVSRTIVRGVAHELLPVLAAHCSELWKDLRSAVVAFGCCYGALDCTNWLDFCLGKERGRVLQLVSSMHDTDSLKGEC